MNNFQPVFWREMRRRLVADDDRLFVFGVVLAPDADAAHRAEFELLPSGVDLGLQHGKALGRRRCTVGPIIGALQEVLDLSLAEHRSVGLIIARHLRHW